MLKTAKKYLLAFPESKERTIIRELEKAGCFEIESIEGAAHSEQSQNADYLLAQADFALSFLKPYSKEKRSFLKSLSQPFIAVKQEKLNEFGKSKTFSKISQRAADIEKEKSHFENKLKEAERKLAELASFGNLAFCPKDTRHFSLFLASMPSLSQEGLFNDFLKEGFYFNQLSQEQNKTYILLAVLKEKKDRAIEVLKASKAEVINYNFNKPPQEERLFLKEEIKSLQARLDALEKELYVLALKLPELKIYRDALAMEKTFFTAKTKQKQGAFLKYNIFWALEENVKILANKLPKIAKDVSFIELKLKEDEQPPVVLHNNKAIEPFEYVTEIFGAPKASEIDPTPYLSFFFILFFGICITDAAYGLIMALFCGLALLLLKERFGKNKLIKLLFYAGISTSIVGVLFGSYFGAGPEKLGLGFLARFKLLDPFEDTILFLGLAFALGFLQLFFSQIVKVIAGVKGKNKPLMLNGIAWGIAYIFGVLFALGSFKYPALKPFGLYGLIASGLGLLLAESMGVKLFLKPLAGAVKVLQGLIGVMSDILSYSRLMALGLATAVIALIVNQIAGLFGSMIPVVGFLVAGLILVGGHLFNLGINALGGFIHSGRLQFVEFFPKFLEGGGRRLKPLKGELKYTKVIN